MERIKTIRVKLLSAMCFYGANKHAFNNEVKQIYDIRKYVLSAAILVASVIEAGIRGKNENNNVTKPFSEICSFDATKHAYNNELKQIFDIRKNILSAAILFASVIVVGSCGQNDKNKGQ